MTNDITVVHICLLLIQTLLLLGSTQRFFSSREKRTRTSLRRKISIFMRGLQNKNNLKQYYVITLDKHEK
jgi:hypothetical protein